MTSRASKSKNSIIALTIAAISLVIIALLITSYFPNSNSRINAIKMPNQEPKQSSPPESVTRINETNSLNMTSPLNNNSSAPPKTNPNSSSTLTSATYKVPYLPQPRYFSPPNSYQDQIAESDLTIPINEINTNETSVLNMGNPSNNTSPPLSFVPILLNASDFITYTYGGYSVQQENSTHFIFLFPDCTNQGQIAGSDALTLNNFSIQKLEFDAVFIASNISALGFDEMAIFVTSNTATYKGTEFGVRMDLEDGFIHGYIQEPSESNADVNFNMIQLLPNDGLIHHYTIVMSGSEVSFYIDDIIYSCLNFPSNSDYSNLNFSICAVVHRFSDGWDSNGDSMITGNFSLNQQ